MWRGLFTAVPFNYGQVDTNIHIHGTGQTRLDIGVYYFTGDVYDGIEVVAYPGADHRHLEALLAHAPQAQFH